MIGGVEDGSYKLKILAVAKARLEFFRRHGLTADDAVLVTPTDTDVFDSLFLDPPKKLLSSFGLFIRPKPMALNETLPFIRHSHHPLMFNSTRWLLFSFKTARQSVDIESDTTIKILVNEKILQKEKYCAFHFADDLFHGDNLR
ncbi:16S rRNA G966 N2-methylase RsmD [Neorhizobium galegae]|uniref:hypothetical protein n=1 Tax=Neorhizobium galegae TaxID=399 RepID=UPI001ED0C1C3|nr:hypothetical protein [Neorhizobium galegae]MBP2562529.1 16S rRNA G966 N2-methylase RsmD [Neorhizobium galegae]